MFERYLSDLVTAHFGHVIENLDAEKVRLSAWNGELVLRDLTIRKQALDNILADQCPVEVAYGNVGHLELRLPWKLIRSQLWRSSSAAASDASRYGVSVVLTDVNILLTPRQQSSVAETSKEPTSPLSVEEKRLLREEKIQDLLAAALLKRVTQASDGKPGANKNRWQWVRDLASRLLSNLSVTVRNIHVRYEDPGCCMGFNWKSDQDANLQRYRPSFAIGITLRQFSLQTADPGSIAGFGKSDPSRKKSKSPKEDGSPNDATEGAEAKTIHNLHNKIAAAYRLAVYWDSDTNLIAFNTQMGDLFEPLTGQFETSSAELQDNISLAFAALNEEKSPEFRNDLLYRSPHSYLLDPVSPSLALSLVTTRPGKTESYDQNDMSETDVNSIDHKPSGSLSEPPSELNLLLPPCHFAINRGMLEDIAYLRRSFSLWRHDKKGFLSDSSLRYLTTLRPTTSVMNNPRAWWRYAFEATKILVTATRGDLATDGAVGRKNQGWLGLVKSLAKRRQYIAFYQQLIDAKESHDREEIHASLLQMEDGLHEEEIVAFRLTVYSEVSSAKVITEPLRPDDSKKGTKQKQKTTVVPQNSRDNDCRGSQIGTDSQHFLLAVEHRCRIFEEMSVALEREVHAATQEIISFKKLNGSKLSSITKQDAVVWKALMQCKEFSLQVNDQHVCNSQGSVRPCSTPIVRLSFAWIQEQLVREDTSWEVDCVVASFTAEDMTKSHGRKIFPNLIGRKSREAQPGEIVVIDGKEHFRSLGVTIKRKRPRIGTDGADEKSASNEGSTTWTQVRVAPLEVVYSTVPVEALSRVFASFKTPELADDFQRMKAVALTWRERQKKRLLKALAHRQKKIFVDVDASAPLFLIPEDISREDSPMVVIDLGRLRFYNSELNSDDARQTYDSKWQLSLTAIQVQCSIASSVLERTKNYDYAPFNDNDSWQQMVEPFSLDFSIETITCQSDADSTRIYVTAMLPRLVFNLSSSAVRLVLRLKSQWAERKSEIEKNVARNAQQGDFGDKPKNNATHDGETLIVGLEFKLSAPLVALRLENDVDGRDCQVRHESMHFKVLSRQPSTRIVNLSLRGIQGRILKEILSADKSSLLVEAKLHSLDAIDLYQAAGDDFSLLLSSRSPDCLSLNFPHDRFSDWQSILDGSHASDTDLVSFELLSSSNVHADATRVELRFHELYVDWNPETIAAIQKAIRLPVKLKAEPAVEERVISESGEESIDSDEEFFDAVEDVAGNQCELSIVSEISSTPSSSFSDAAECQPTEPFTMASGSYMLNGLQLNKQLKPVITLSPCMNSISNSNTVNSENSNHAFKVLFNLTKLRVRFNKESRHRRLLTAEMDETAVQFARQDGGSKTTVTIGNLVFVDSSGGPTSTLYGEILGLQAQSTESVAKPSSLLNMEIEIHRKERKKGFVEVSQVPAANSGVVVDALNGRITGSDYFLTAHFSPMRFVFLEQLWFEIVDYFFEGIIGSTVWGARNPAPLPDLRIEGSGADGALTGWNAEGITFTRFDVVLQSPVVLVPVTYRSTQFIRLVMDTISVTNYYQGSVERTPNSVEGKETAWLQWFNNCVVELENLKLVSWNRVELTKGKESVGARITVRWPTGAHARLLIPKWNVHCRFDNLNLALRPQDCALFQHVVLHNIGEPSRHIDEWHALQSLSPQDLLRYREHVMVHFGYDKKDVAPSTFKVVVILPSVKLALVTENGRDETVSQACCTNFTWSLVKVSDCISRQRITCDIDLVDPCGDGPPVKMIAPGNKHKPDDEERYELTYTSTSRPSGDCVKSLEISNACIYIVYPSWMKFVRFFQDLPEPVILTEKDVSLSVQVGDRWYRIDGGTPRCNADQTVSIPWKERRDSLAKQLETLPTHQFRVFLITPSIVLQSTPVTGDQKSVVLRVQHFDYLSENNGSLKTVSRFVCLHDLEMYTCNQREHKTNDFSLIHPWSVAACVRSTSSNLCSVQVRTDVLRARAAFSDMTVVLEVILRVLADISAFEASFPVAAKSPGWSSEPSPVNQLAAVSEPTERDFSREQSRNTVGIECAGFELLVIDDSKRHFADTQDLVILRLGKVCVLRENVSKEDVGKLSESMLEPPQPRSTDSNPNKAFTVELQLHHFEILDCLQSASSPFHVVATSRSGLLDSTDSILNWYDSAQWTNEYDSTIEEFPRLPWSQFRSRDDDEWGYHGGPAFEDSSRSGYVAWVKGAEQDLVELTIFVDPCTVSSYELKLRSIAMQWNPSTVIALQRFLGRFLKEARTEALNTVRKPLEKVIARRVHPADDEVAEIAPLKESSQSARLSIGTMTICLNKEHQNRRLLQLRLSDCLVSVDRSHHCFGVSCEVGNLTAFDTDKYDTRRGGPQMLPQNRFVLKMAWPDVQVQERERRSFLQLRYKSYQGSRNRPQVLASDIPSWVRVQLQASKSSEKFTAADSFDDFLSVSVARLQFSFIRERTEEILDYLSNGLPGKGMGATTRAAQGFLKERIQTRSFLELNVEAPNIVVPQDESTSRGLMLRLGDVGVRSWFEEGSLNGPVKDKARSDGEHKAVGDEEWWRMLSLSLSGLCAGCWKRDNRSSDTIFSACTKPIDLEVLLQKPTWRCQTSTLTGTLSFVDLILSYSDYLLIHAILKSNIGHQIDRDRWDNVEKSFWMEQQELDTGLEIDVASSIPEISALAVSFKNVTYSSSARFVRYGQKRSGPPKKLTPAGDSGTSSSETVWTEFEIKFELGGLSLKLRRDDQVDAVTGFSSSPDIASAFNYDLILLSVQLVEVSFSANSAGDKSFHLSLFTLGLFDLGESGRLARESYYSSLLLEKGVSISGRQLRLPCAFTVMAEGYSSFVENARTNEVGNVDPQIVVTVDTCAASSIGATGSISRTSGLDESERVTMARIVVNFLTVNALIRPLKEVINFLSCAWASPHDFAQGQCRLGEVEGASLEQSTESLPNQQRNNNFQLKLVAHYPRIFFVADESDIHSRALVLTGLAVVNASRLSQTASLSNELVELPSVRNITTVDAQLHRMESYMNPDVASALGLKQRHVELLAASIALLPPFVLEEDYTNANEHEDLLGVALIQPVTVGIEFSRDCRPFFPTTRFLSVNMEPVSTMLSFEDLQLIEVVLRRWSAKRNRSPSETQPHVEEDSLQERTEQARKQAQKLAAFGTSKPFQITYEIVFYSRKLGLGLRKESFGVVVDQVLDSEHSGSIREGDVLVSVNGFNVLSKSLSNVVQLLSNTSRPTNLKFCRRDAGSAATTIDGRAQVISHNAIELKNNEKDSAQQNDVNGHFTMKLRRGRQNGLLLERSSSGNVPIVSGINRILLASSMFFVSDGEGQELSTRRIPFIGAVIVSVNEHPSLELGFHGIISYLDGLCSSHIENESEDSDSPTYSLTFAELPSLVWGNLDAIDFSLSGAVLTFIDDLKGRDMPLFRGNLGPIIVHLEKGKGLETSIVGGSPLQKLLEADFSATDDATCDYVVKLSAMTRAGIEYFHPKIAVWEPVLEPSQLCLVLEWRAGYVAIEISDHLQRNNCLGSQQLLGEVLPQLVCLNLSDAAVEVMAQALREWSEWRRGLTKTVPDNEKLLDHDISLLGNLYLSHGEISGLEKAESLPGVRVSSTSSFESVDKQELTTEDRDLMKYRIAKKIAAQKAAQAALVFAQKRGAGAHDKGEPAKPFVFRNRVGVSIAFAQESTFPFGRHSSNNNVGIECGTSSLLSVVGEYVGLEDYDSSAVTELADGQDAKFTMDADFDELTTKGNTDSDLSSNKSSKVRTYEGRFPRLTVAIQSVSGVTVGALSDLPVVKAGSSVRQLHVRKDFPETHRVLEYRVPVLWEVEIEDNRRMLTLASAVRIECLALGTSIEVGVTTQSAPVQSGVDQSIAIKTVGFARPGSPFYLPIWLSLKLEVVRVHIRPSCGDRPEFSWGKKSVLEFSPREKLSGDSGGEWFWKESFLDSTSIECTTKKSIDGSHSAWLSCHASRKRESFKVKEAQFPRQEYQVSMRSIISISVDSGITIRNLLPINIEWEVACERKGKDPQVLDGSSFRQRLDDQRLFPTAEPTSPANQICSLTSGDCAEVFACEFGITSTMARFKCDGISRWSSWASISCPGSETFDKSKASRRGAETTGDEDASAIFLSARQVNIQIRNNFGVPLTIGVKTVPKMAKSLLEVTATTSYYGVEIIVYAELWFRNLTSLPLNIGCPTLQLVGSGGINEKGNEDIVSEDIAAKFTAEAALMEMASVLEFGERGTGLTNRYGSLASAACDIRLMPLQECQCLVEEVFEYVEIEKSVVKRKWWASELYDALRPNLTEIEDAENDWRWIDECWNIDCLRADSAASGGWESCRSLVGEKENVFSNTRDFNPLHNFRRRRWFRRREPRESRLCCGIQAFHQPIPDAFTLAQIQARNKQQSSSADSARSTEPKMDITGVDSTLRVCVRIGGGRWSDPALIPLSGPAHGVLRVGASRWPTLTKLTPRKQLLDICEKDFSVADGSPPPKKGKSPELSPKLFELCYNVSDLEGDWGEFSRLMLLSPRFFVRNDSSELTMEIKQTGAPDDTLLRLTPGEASPFHWSDFRLPELVSVRPSMGEGQSFFKWSGGFDICRLGMTAVRVRHAHRMPPQPSNHILQAGYPFECIRSVRAMVEIRRGTGGSGINISFQEEDPTGDGSLFRIENLSTFPVWFAQDGVLANPSASFEQNNAVNAAAYYTSARHKTPTTVGWTDDHAEVDGDLILPGDKLSFALDVPFRQGKYAGRQAATISELARVRVALAPLSTRPGIETIKVVEFSEVGNRVRLNPSKLNSILDGDLRTFLARVRVLCVVTTDGPTRVLKLCLMEKDTTDSVFGNPFGDTSIYSSASPNSLHHFATSVDGGSSHKSEMLNAAVETAKILEKERLPNEDDAVRSMFFGNNIGNSANTPKPDPRNIKDMVFSVRAEFSGFVFSLIDSSPSEIAVASLKNVNALARWNALRTSDASAIISVGWLQVDNHIPNAPFPVAIFPIERLDNEDDSTPEIRGGLAPLLVIGLTFAPKHKSGMVCLRSVTVAPRNLGVAIDLAFLVRLQRYLGGIQSHMKGQSQDALEGGRQHGTSAIFSDHKKIMPLPDVDGFVLSLENAVEVGVASQKFYFGGLSILPCNIKLSVAPARALTSEQATLEGAETAAIHEAVRKGDVLLGGRTALLGVKVGRKNTTALAVVRGVLKSIVVDALLRLDGASLSFAGFFLRNHITTGSQLRTYIGAHYLASLRNNFPALLGSLAALGNPLGLIRGLGDGVTDFVTEPVKGLKKSVQELDPFFLVDGVARGTESLARHAVGGFADSASLLTETFSKNMAVLTLDRRYAQKRDRGKTLRGQQGDLGVTFVEGVESGMIKLVQGFLEGVTGVVKAPLRGAEKKGLEGFAKGIGKGLLGLLVKPMIGISDAATDVMIGVKGSVESGSGFHRGTYQPSQLRPRRPMYGRDKVLRAYQLDDAAASSLMTRTRLAGELYLSHVDMAERVALLSVKRLLLLGANGQEQLLLKFKHVASVEVRPIDKADGERGWGIIVKLNTPRSNGSEIEVITCSNEVEARELCSQIQHGVNMIANES